MTIAAATKYRVEIRALAVEQGWKFTQTTTSTDRFEREGVVVEVHHGAANRIAAAEKAGAGIYDSVPRKSAGKFFTVRSWLTGEPVSKKYVALTDEQVASFESGKGVALIKKIAPKKDTKVEAAAKV